MATLYAFYFPNFQLSKTILTIYESLHVGTEN